jgi:hypothetical protein
MENSISKNNKIALYCRVSTHNQTVCSQIKMNFFAQNLREVSANLVKNFDTVFF